MSEYTRRLRAEIASLEAMLPLLGVKHQPIWRRQIEKAQARLAAELAVHPEPEGSPK